MVCYQSVPGEVPDLRFCGHERGACGLEKNVDIKCMQLNALQNIARMTRRLCVLIMSRAHFKVNLHFEV